MLGREIETSNNENSGLQSGFDTKKVGGIKTVRSQFKEALTLNQLQVTEAQVTKAALANGQAKGQAELLERLSQQKLEQAAHLNETFRIATEHHSKATTEELKFQRQSKKFLQEMSPKLLDTEIEQQHHEGYKYYCASAEVKVRMTVEAGLKTHSLIALKITLKRPIHLLLIGFYKLLRKQ